MVALTSRQERELSALRRTFVAQLPARIEAVAAAVSAALRAEPLDAERLETAFLLAHRLCGAAGIYGVPSVHAPAAALEDLLTALRGQGADARQAFDAARQLTAALSQGCAEALAETAPARAPRPRRVPRRPARQRNR